MEDIALMVDSLLSTRVIMGAFPRLNSMIWLDNNFTSVVSNGSSTGGCLFVLERGGREIGSGNVTQVGSELSILLPQPPEC